jgi:uncharacterized protein (DUF2267 family)
MHSLFETTYMKSLEWVHDVMRELGTDDERKGLRALRAGLHAIRDRLPAGEAVDLGAQLPMLLRGLYYEGWRLADRPIRVRSFDELIELVRWHLGGPRLADVDPVEVLRAVMRVLGRHVSAGELEQVVHSLPRPLARFWMDNMLPA